MSASAPRSEALGSARGLRPAALSGLVGESMRVLRMDPRDGSKGVFRDAPVVVSLSRPATAESVALAGVRVESGGGIVPGQLGLSPDAMVVIWTPLVPLVPEREHVVYVAGLRDHRGTEITPYQSRFVPCGLSLEDLLQPDF